MDQTTLIITVLDIFVGFVIWCIFVIGMICIGQSDLPEDVYNTTQDKIITPALKMIKSGINKFVTSFNKLSFNLSRSKTNSNEY